MELIGFIPDTANSRRLPLMIAHNSSTTSIIVGKHNDNHELNRSIRGHLNVLEEYVYLFCRCKQASFARNPFMLYRRP